MKFSVSSLSFFGPNINNMALLPKDIGIEIFYEWGSRDYWNYALEIIMHERTGGFSIHSPFINVDISMPCDEKKLFDTLRAPFEQYQRYNADFYVVHTNGLLPLNTNKQFEADCRKRAKERLIRFQEICAAEKIRMVVENLGFRKGEKHLFNEHQFLDLFSSIPGLLCLLDTGHSVLAGFNICKIQKTLKNRLVAYHVHDNDGLADQHLRIGNTGRIDWNKFAEGFRKFTPDAIIVMEYNTATIKNYLEDKDKLVKLIQPDLPSMPETDYTSSMKLEDIAD